jgi:hypothetical protein
MQRDELPAQAQIHAETIGRDKALGLWDATALTIAPDAGSIAGRFHTIYN